MNEGPRLDFRVVPASRGLAWLINAARLVRSQLWRLLAVAVIVQLIMGFTRVPVIGLIIALAIPVVTAGMLQCFHQVRLGLPLSPVVLFSPLRAAALAVRLFLLGGLIGLVAVILISWMLSGVAELSDPELLARLEQGDLEAALSLSPSTLQRVFLSIGVGVAVSGTLGYFAVPLLWFRHLSVGAALSTGIKALVKNWLPFLVLGGVLVAISLPLFLVLGLVLGITAVTGGPGIIQYALFMLAILVVQLLMFGTQYCAYSDIFSLGGEPAMRQENHSDDQLIA